ncbi:MAG TPA: SIP domain-containing protein [Iamia sp.]|jgi:NADPH-dependent ferric siderophore reductase|nr:SIP domain-containing protein [Iamia sp.]
MASPLTGLVEVVSRPLFRAARVDRVDDLTPRVRLASFTVAGLAPGSWRPGDKVQVRMAGLTTRTYTPLEREGGADGFRIVGFVHGDGPGARWVRALEPGVEVAVFGPRRSVDCSHLKGRVVVVGDETSVGLAAAVAGVEGATVETVFEATDPDDVRVPAERLGLVVEEVVPRQGGGAHLPALADLVAQHLAGADATLVISGDAATVAAVRRHLKDTGLRPVRTLAKAYWAEGRRGLD